MTDLDIVQRRLQALIGDQHPTRVLTLVHEGIPIPKARPRVTPDGRRLYNPKRTTDAQRSLGWAFVKAMDHGPVFTDRVALLAIFYRPDRRRLDVDNLMKLVMDAATKAKVWNDDSQVTAQAALLELDPARPRTVIALCPYLSAHSRAPLLTETEGR